MAAFFSLITGSAGLILFFLAQLCGMILIPFGVPGTMLQVLAAILLAHLTNGAKMPWGWVGAFFGIALVGEVIEFLSGQWGAKRFGGAKKAAWGALIGGFGGAIFGGMIIPVPLIGSLIGSFFGTFAGAVYGQMREEKTRELRLRVGFGAVLGRAIGVAVKLFIALVILIVSVVLVTS